MLVVIVPVLRVTVEHIFDLWFYFRIAIKAMSVLKVYTVYK